MNTILTKSKMLGIYLALISFSAVAAKPLKTAEGRPGRDSSLCLEITGKISFDHKHTDHDYRIDLICYNSVVSSVTTDNKKGFRFFLNRNACYTIRISKKGYVTRWISIDTDLENGGAESGFYKFHFDTDLIKNEDAKNLDADALEFPIAIISFDAEAGWFYHNEAYTANIKKEIYNSKNITINSK